VFADAFSRDPEFFEFYRSMKAYETAIRGSDTTMVLSPDSEFFRFFKNSEGSVPKAPAPASTPATQ
jgi:membrane protease subunit HflC